MPIGAYRNVPLPIRPVPPVPKTHLPKLQRSILTLVPKGGWVRKHVCGNRWMI